MNNITLPQYIYHGTTDYSLNKILESLKLINTDYWKQDRDFGSGFYTTVDLNQAKSFAKYKAQIHYQEPCVIKISCEHNDVEEIVHNVFLGPNRKWSDFILGNRIERISTIEADIITGPLADNKIGDVISKYKRFHKDNPEWFYQQILTKKNGSPIENPGNQIVFSNELLAKRLLKIDGWYYYDDKRGWNYESNIG